jgi:hypothetical protein
MSSAVLAVQTAMQHAHLFASGPQGRAEDEHRRSYAAVCWGLRSHNRFVLVRRLVVMSDSDERKSPMDGNNLKCSFCSKEQRQVEQLIAGPGVAICNECVDLCNEIIEDARATSPIPPRRWRGAPDAR